MAVTEQQIRVYMSQRRAGKKQVTAAAKAGLSERTARRVEQGQGGHSGKPRHWRTRADPLADVWDCELVPQLERDGDLQALTLLEWLQEQHPGQYPDKLLRTLQRRVKDWRARHGPDKEVMFPQAHGPGLQGLSDFTQLKGVAITIAGAVLAHRLYHFRLAHSGWCHVRIVLGGESYTALAEGLTAALERLGGVPAEHRTDSLSAAFKNLDTAAAADITERYQALCRHYGMRASRNNPGIAHENGSIEAAHGHLKRRIQQRLSLRGSVDFDSIEAYQAFIDEVANSINRRNARRIAAERAELAPLPCQRGVDYTETVVRVTTSSTITLGRELYSVPARLIGERLRVHLYDNRLVLYHGGRELMTLTRVRPGPGRPRVRCIDYRHVIRWLVRKPRALAGLAFRDELLPGPAWRAIYHQLSQQRDTADVCKRVVAALGLAAEHDCADQIGEYWLDALDRGHNPTLAELQARFAPPAEAVPVLSSSQHDLADYDALLPGYLPVDTAPPAEAVCHG
ncbi:MAG: IS21 family transposase [Salinisphaera sp.]|jgi:transposase InsO family protein|nr:IS21 family transposase [Salinisphaera sp.]